MRPVEIYTTPFCPYCHAAKRLLQKKGAQRILAAGVHGVLSGPALDRINASPIEKVLRGSAPSRMTVLNRSDLLMPGR